MNQRMKGFVRELRRQGYAVSPTRGGHLRITHPDLREVVFAPATPGDLGALRGNKMRVFAILLAVALSGCLTPQERAQQAQERAQQLREQWAAADDAKCRSYGSKPGEPAYVQCRTQLDASRTQAAAAESAANITAASVPHTCVCNQVMNATQCY
jgi:predicted RNA binding protein YcfA (HicA-like mRNA interferase family)